MAITEFLLFVLTATLGRMFLCGANDFITIFVAPECFSLCSYLLSGYTKKDVWSNKATMKYLLMGAASSSILEFQLRSYSLLLELDSSFHQLLLINGLLTYTKECGSFEKFLPLYLSLRCLDFSKLHGHAEEKCYPHSDQDRTFTCSNNN
ncbi:hypothetical protein M9H77_23618 [Catharanthus roseus]|uniref:Uncharacterized protein n=1 Tax=Catharanthus roseus TaxID=4058 RepID=A0ACC0AVI9_CATRO|nr:hypothetical protein M9H77_23618 [Catharanthus roseus]